MQHRGLSFTVPRVTLWFGKHGFGMWGHELSPRRVIVLVDPSRQVKLGNTPQNHELVTFEELKVGSTSVDVFRIVHTDQDLIVQLIDSAYAATTAAPTKLVVLVLNWLETDNWPGQLAAVEGLPLLITTINYLAAVKSKAAADLSIEVDTCRQYLRVQAMIRSSPLIYSTTNTETDLLPYINHILGIHPQQFENNYLGPRVVIFEDSKDRILAVNPQFDYDSALTNHMELPLLHNREAELPVKPQDNLKRMLESSVADAAKAEHFDSKESPESVPLMTDDKQVISEFFTKIAQKST